MREMFLKKGENIMNNRKRNIFKTLVREINRNNPIYEVPLIHGFSHGKIQFWPRVFSWNTEGEEDWYSGDVAVSCKGELIGSFDWSTENTLNGYHSYAYRAKFNEDINEN